MIGNRLALYDETFFCELISKAETNPRHRQHHNIHNCYTDPCQRLFNALTERTFIRPHRHFSDPKNELLIAISGHMVLVTFCPSGNITDITHLKPTTNEIDVAVGANISPETWHTVIALEPNCVLLEVKAGPFDQSSPKDLASWAPEEGTREAGRYLEQLRMKIQNWK